ncbi:MAG: threonine synthase [Bacteroidales bacterium]|nr:threonine synthase [Bacteroidales bacterium]MDZ4205435.1 threonine synthase [Bacteroidales bacterium]
MHSIKYYSTNLKATPVSFGEALLNGQAPDKGLYMPEHIPTLSAQELESMAGLTYPEIAFTVLDAFLKHEIPGNVLKKLVNGAYDFDVPLQLVSERKYVMRLDQGPTASFKDFAARMMGRLMSYFLAKRDHELLILTATSGDTGSAIANAFYGLENIKVLVLFPEKEVSPRQRKQMTTLGKNVRTVAVDGKFDECQAMVKRAFADPALQHLNLSSANSINIGRLLPQAVYYFYAWSQLRNSVDDKPVFVIPSGNFGDMMGGMIAWSMGLPVNRMVIAVNENDEFKTFLNTGVYQKIEPSLNCLSSAMNVGHPSNLARLVALYGGVMDETGAIHQLPEMSLMRNDLYAISVSDALTKQTIFDAWHKHQLLLEPHGAVGWAGLQQYLVSCKSDNKDLYIVLETAHPAKFPEQIQGILHFDPDLPASLQGLEEKKEQYGFLSNDYESFREFLMNTYD